MSDNESASADPGRRDAYDSSAAESTRAAETRDEAATARDEAADDRDTASVSAATSQRAVRNRLFAAEDRAAAARDREETASRSAAASNRDTAAQDRAAAALDRAETATRAKDRSAAALDRRDAAARDVAATARDVAAQARDNATAFADEAQHADEVHLAAEDRAAAAHDRAAAAMDRAGAADELQNAYRDDLTGTLVRAAGRDQLMQAVARAHRTSEALVVAFVDVDHLKRVNDEHGHVAGDDLLRAVGAALREGLRSYDVVVRYGGDEFVCGLPDVGIAEADRRFIDVADLLSAKYPEASLSIGLAELQQAETGSEVIDRADQEMYNRRRSRHQAPPDSPTPTTVR